MAVNDFFMTHELCKKHCEWRIKYIHKTDYFKVFCDEFYNFTGHNKHKLNAFQLAQQLNTLNISNSKIKKPTNYCYKCKHQVKNKYRIDDINGFCDITDFLQIIKKKGIWIVCWGGLKRFVGYGLIVRIGNTDYTYGDEAALQKVFVANMK